MTKRYQEYPEYKNSGVEWLGAMPEHWIATELKRYCNVTDGSHHSPSVQIEGYPFISVTDVGENEIDFANCKRITQSDYIRLVKEGCKPQVGDVVLTKDGTIGRAAIVKEEDEDFVILSSLGLLSPTSRLTNSFLYYYLVSGINVDQMNSMIHGSALKRMTINKIDCLKVTLPAIDEQQKIANFLDHETAKIDTLIAKQEKLIALLKEKRQAVISHAVTRGLPSPNGSDTPMKDSGVEWLGEVPEHWLHTSLKHYSNVIDCKHITAEFFDEGIPLASIGEVKDWFVNLKNAKLTNKKYYHDLIGGGRTPQVGDIIYSRNATVGEAAIVSDNLPLFALGQDVCLLRQSKKISSVYLMFVLHSGVISQQLELAMVGSTFKRINVENIKRFLIAVPPFEEQEMIVKELEKKLAQYDSLISNAVNAIELIKERKTALISAAVTGKIDVRNWQEQ